jgi:putative endonuclease
MKAWLGQIGDRAAAQWRWFWGRRKRSGTTADRRGRAGEETAASFLRERGWKIIARNWWHQGDELDVVAWDGEVLVFAEIRTRAARAAVTAYHSVNWRKKRAISRAARAFLRGMAQPPAHFRFDIVEVKVSDGAAPEVLLHANIPLFSKNFHLPRAAARGTRSHG